MNLVDLWMLIQIFPLNLKQYTSPTDNHLVLLLISRYKEGSLLFFLEYVFYLTKFGFFRINLYHKLDWHHLL